MDNNVLLFRTLKCCSCWHKYDWRKNKIEIINKILCINNRILNEFDNENCIQKLMIDEKSSMLKEMKYIYIYVYFISLSLTVSYYRSNDWLMITIYTLNEWEGKDFSPSHISYTHYSTSFVCCSMYIYIFFFSQWLRSDNESRTRE